MNLACLRIIKKSHIDGLLLFSKYLPTLNLRFLSQDVSDKSSSKFHIGTKFSIKRRFSSEDVKLFANLSGDHNPIHIDENYASRTKFKKPIVHGMLVNSLFSGLLANNFGSGSVLLSMECAYLQPVFVGEEVTAEIEVKELSGLKIVVVLRCISNSTEKILIKGSAKGFLPRQSNQPDSIDKVEPNGEPKTNTQK